MELTIKVICEDLLGTKFVDTQGTETMTRDGVYLGIQRADDVVEAVPANRKRAVFEPTFRVTPLPEGRTNFLGPYAKGTPQERFFYLAWVVKNATGTETMFGRAKVHLSQLPWVRVEEAVRSGRPLCVELSMTDKRGGPLCGSVRGEHVRWQI